LAFKRPNYIAIGITFAEIRHKSRAAQLAHPWSKFIAKLRAEKVAFNRIAIPSQETAILTKVRPL
jgi:hypothetical protein